MMRIVGIEAENFKLFADKFDHIQDVENDDLVILNLDQMDMEKQVYLILLNFV